MLILFTALIYLPGLWSECSFTQEDEFVLTIPTAQENIESNRFWVPYLNGEPVGNKPPLIDWLLIGLTKQFGLSLFVLCVPGVVVVLLAAGAAARGDCCADPLCRRGPDMAGVRGGPRHRMAPAEGTGHKRKPVAGALGAADPDSVRPHPCAAGAIHGASERPGRAGGAGVRCTEQRRPMGDAVDGGFFGCDLAILGGVHGVVPGIALGLCLIMVGVAIVAARALIANRALTTKAIAVGIWILLAAGVMYPTLGVNEVPKAARHRLRNGTILVATWQNEMPNFPRAATPMPICRVRSLIELGEQFHVAGLNGGYLPHEIEMSVVVSGEHEESFLRDSRSHGATPYVGDAGGESHVRDEWKSFATHKTFLQFARQCTTFKDWMEAFRHRSSDGLRERYKLYVRLYYRDPFAL